MEDLGRILIVLGLIIVFFGLLLLIYEKLPFGIGKLPGDIYIKRDNFVFYFPLATSIIISLVFSLIFYILSKLTK